jgi:hypothetical protein
MGTSVTLVAQYGNPTFSSLIVNGPSNISGSFFNSGSISATSNLAIAGTASFDAAKVKLIGGGNYNENIRCSAQSNDYSSLILGAVSGDSGTGVGQWSLVRWPSANSYKFTIRYNASDHLTIDTSGNLTMVGTIASSGITSTGNQYINNGSPTIYLQDTDNRSSMIHCNSNIFYVLRGSGTNSTSWATYNGYWPMELSLENNNATFGGSVTAVYDITAYSDARVKTNIKTIDNALDKVLQLRGVSYQRTDMESDKTHIGVIAQEVEKILPEVVNENDKGHLNVAYGNIVSILIEAIKEQQLQIEELKAKIG